MKRLAIIGAGDLGQLIAYHAAQTGQFKVIGYYDDWASHGARFQEAQVLGNLRSITPSFHAGIFDVLMIGIGYNHMAFRKSVFGQHAGTIPFGTLVHPSAYIDSSVQVGEGTFVLPGCVVDAHAVLGQNVLLNAAAVVAHDTTIGAHSFLAPSASIAGKTNIGECCIIGINSTIIDNLSIAPGTRIAAGAVVTKSIETAGLYAGVPAQIKKVF